MRVLMVSDVYFPRVNGVSTSMATFRRGLQSLGVEVQLVVPEYQPSRDEDLGEAGITRVPGRALPGDPEDRLVRWRLMHQVVETLAAQVDLIHIQTPFVAHYAGLNAARRQHKPVIATYHTLFEEYLQHYAPWLPSQWLKQQARAFSRRQCNALDAVIVPSNALHHRLLEYGVTRPMHILPTGIPLSQFTRGQGERFRQQHQIPMDRPIALYVGRVAHEKNIGFLLEALDLARQKRPDLLLIIAGEGPAEGPLRAQAAQLELGAHLLFLGYMDRQTDLVDCYSAADVFVFASRTETQGLVLLEAMAAGAPVIALAEMGTCDILTSCPAAICPAPEPAAFATALVEYLSRPRSEQMTWRTAAQAYADRWSDLRMAERMCALYTTLLHADR